MALKDLFSRFISPFLSPVGTAADYRSGQTPGIVDWNKTGSTTGSFTPGIIDWNKTGSTTDPTQVLRTQPSLAGSYVDLLEPLKGITNADERRFLMDQIANDRAIKTMLDMTQGREGRDDERALNVIKNLREQQYADRLRSRPLEFQELVAKNLLKTVTDLPGQVVRAGRMYDQEALEANAALSRRPAFQETIRYFA